MVGLSLALMLAKAKIRVKLLEAIRYPDYTDTESVPITQVLMHVIRHFHAGVYRFTRS